MVNLDKGKRFRIQFRVYSCDCEEMQYKFERGIVMDCSKERIKAFLARFFRKHELQDDEDIFSLGFVNSLFSMQLVIFLEEEFKVRIENKDIDPENFKTINAIDDLVRKKLSEQSA
jgi:methoxymalonate biosynthesis acyl carrier protein